MKFFDFDAKKVPDSIEIFDVIREAHEYADGKGPVAKWPKNYLDLESIAAGPYIIDLIEKNKGEHALAISSSIGENEIPGYQSIPVPEDKYDEVKNIFDNLTNVGVAERSGTSLPCMLVGGGNALVLNGYDSTFIPPLPKRSAKAAEAAVLEAKGEQPA